MKTLILAYDFPPFNSVGGLRPKSWERDFSINGVFPIVVTRNWNIVHGDERDYIEQSAKSEVEFEENATSLIIKTPFKPSLSNKILAKYGDSRFKLFRKVLTLILEILQFFIPVGGKKNLYLEAKKYLSSNKVDLILVTGEPFVLFYYAYWLGKKFNLPFVLDYRDPWSQNVTRGNFILRKFYEFLERKVTAKAVGVSTVSNEFKNTISKILPISKVKVFPNGFNQEAFENALSYQQSSTFFNITIAGSTYLWHPVKGFLEELVNVCESQKIQVRFNIVGANELMKNEIKTFKDKFRMPSNLEIRVQKRMSNSKLVPLLLESNVLLLFNDYDIIGTKIFDYIGAKRKVLLCFEDDSVANEMKKMNFHFGKPNQKVSKQAELIMETNCGIVLKDQKQLNLELINLFNEFAVNGSVICHTKDSEKYSRQYSNNRLSEYLKSLI